MNRSLAWVSIIILLACFSLPTQAQQSDLQLPSIFTSGGVLQRDALFPVWGTALSGDSVFVTLNGITQETQTDTDGNWQVDFQAMDAGGPYTMLVVSGADTTTLTDMYVGDVWIASGQSNMEWKVSQLPIASEVIDAANDLQIRQFKVSSTLNSEPSSTIPTNSYWSPATTDFVGNFSAIGYFFADHLRQNVDIPIGIINATYGGSRIETWMSEDMLGYDEQDVVLGDGASHRQPTMAYNSMIHPLLPYPVKGFLWYQGESNNTTLEDVTAYGAQFQTMIQGWRTAWGQGDLPFLWVQLPNFGSVPGATPSESHLWPMFRASQDSALVLPNTGQAITIDVGSSTDIHPPDKEPVGYRLSLLARKMAYGESIIDSGPLHASNVLGADGRVTISYDHVGTGLVADPDGIPGSFTIKGDDGTYLRAEAAIEGDNIVVWHDAITDPVLIRYAWENNPINPNLYNSEGLPAAPFEAQVIPAPEPEALVLDGDFEAGPVIAESPGWLTFSAGEIIHDVWQVTDGTIDVHYYTMDGSGLGLQPEGGLQHIDLQGDNPGRVIQTIDGLTAGETYSLSFYYAAYPYSPIVGTAQAKVTIGGLDHTWTATTSGADSWVQYSGTFTASSTSEELAFEGLGSARQWGGVLIDLVEITSCANGSCEIAVPEVTSFSPDSGYAGNAVTINGSSFTGVVNVSFGSTDAPIFTVVSDTVITATVPSGASTGAITVATASASGSSSSDFVVNESGSTNLLVSGDFEGDPLVESAGWLTHSTGETLYGVWQVVSGSVDLHHYLHASAGVPIYPDAGLHHIDLQGNGPGTVKQTVGGLTVGQKYRISFIYAIYPYFAITEASANVQVGLDGLMLNETWTATNPGNESWESGEFVFEATATSADVQFSGFGSARNWGGMLMDQIVLEACDDCTVGAGSNMQLTEASGLTLQSDLPEEFAIRDAFPNPFNDATEIVFGMPESGYVKMDIYNATGQLIQVLIDGEQPQGYQRVRWKGDDSRGVPVASGVYLIRYEADGSMQTRKIVVVR